MTDEVYVKTSSLGERRIETWEKPLEFLPMASIGKDVEMEQAAPNFHERTRFVEQDESQETMR